MTGKRDLFVSAAIHRAVIDVNEEGTEAAAATGMVMMLRAAMVVDNPPKLICDHPVHLNLLFDRSLRRLMFSVHFVFVFTTVFENGY